MYSIFMLELTSFLPTIIKNPQGNEVRWNKTDIVEQRLRAQKAFYEEKDTPTGKRKFFEGRPTISRDKSINGGVYLGSSAREAIVVDDEKDEALDRIYQELIMRRKAAQTQGIDFKDGILTEVWDLVKLVMPYNENKVNSILNQLTRPDEKVYLSSFIGGGVCRHQALLASYLLERLIKEKYIHGKVSVDRNEIKNEGGHAWCRYTNSAKEVFILDAAQNYIGRLDDMTRANNRWFYERPEDYNKYLKLIAQLKQKIQ